MTLRTINRDLLSAATGGFDWSPLLRKKGQSQAEAAAKASKGMASLMSGAISGGPTDSTKKK